VCDRVDARGGWQWVGTGEPYTQQDDVKPLQRDTAEVGHKGTVHDFPLCLVPASSMRASGEVLRLL